jgi:hypothetical protein
MSESPAKSLFNAYEDKGRFYEYFHGDTGRGLGASHQTGWTALLGILLLEMDEE